MNTYERRTQVADDLRKLSDTIRSHAEIPVHELGTFDIMYCVIEGAHDEREAWFNAHADDMQRIAAETGLGFMYASSIGREGGTHHRATLVMPHGKVMYTVVWIEKAEQVTPDAE